MPNEARNVLGAGKICSSLKCNTRMGTHEAAIEVDGRVYHKKCAPTPVSTNCRVRIPESMRLGYST